jgi:myo-inositol-1(or 4)-monophosphatase
MGRYAEPTLAGLLSVGNRAVGVAAELIRIRRPAAVTAKGDRDQVTDVDLAVEQAIRNLLAEATPGIGFLGEEEGRSAHTARAPQI